MASLNKRPPPTPQYTAGGSKAVNVSPLQQLRRSVLSCLLWEDEFYEDGTTIADRIDALVQKVPSHAVANLAIEARSTMQLRHVPLLLLCALAKKGDCKDLAVTVQRTIQRPDEITQLLAVYWRNGKTPIAKQLKKGLAAAFNNFSAETLAKYDRAGDKIRLRDVAFLVHAKPELKNGLPEGGYVATEKKLAKPGYKRGKVNRHVGTTLDKLIKGTLETPDTWETELSAGKDKKATFERLITEGKLGYFALLRNLRNMEQAKCDMSLVRDAIIARKNGAHRILPFRFIAAARACPQMEPALDKSLQTTISELPPLNDVTIVMVDVSGSMDDRLSAKSDLRRVDAAAALASIINAKQLRVFSFADKLMELPPRRGMAGVDAICTSQSGGTRLFEAIRVVNTFYYDRLIVITDEQDTTMDPRGCPAPNAGTRGYMINVASNKNGVGYGSWTHIDGFSENVLRWIVEIEREKLE